MEGAGYRVCFVLSRGDTDPQLQDKRRSKTKIKFQVYKYELQNRMSRNTFTSTAGH